MRYKGSNFLNVHEQRFITGGDFISHDGTGSATVYPEENKGKTMQAEVNTQASFNEPYLLAMSANAKGETGCQFFVTLDSLPVLNGTKHTIIGRLLKGKETLQYLEGI